MAKIIGVAILIFALVIFVSTSSYVVQPGYRGVEVTLGKVSPVYKPEGFGLKTPLIARVVPVSVRQQTRAVQADCYSSDLQQVKMDLRVLYRVPESSVVRIFQEYAGDPFDNLIAPRIQEALKEITALQSAEQIVKKREEIKTQVLNSARAKVGNLLVLNDVVVQNVVVQNIDLSKELETAIEAKMVQEQEAAKAKFTQAKAEVEAATAIIKAKGEAESIRIRGEALKANPAFIELQIVEKWDGKSPLVVGGGSGGANILFPIRDLESERTTNPAPPRR
jgi:prohibitin 2